MYSAVHRPEIERLTTAVKIKNASFRRCRSIFDQGRLTRDCTKRGEKKREDGVDHVRRGRIRMSHRLAKKRGDGVDHVHRGRLRTSHRLAKKRDDGVDHIHRGRLRTNHVLIKIQLQTFGNGNGFELGRAVVKLGQHGLFMPRNRKVRTVNR